MVSQILIQAIISLCHHLESVKAQLTLSCLFDIELHFTGHKYGLYISLIILVLDGKGI